MDAATKVRMKDVDDAATDAKSRSWKTESNVTIRIMQT